MEIIVTPTDLLSEPADLAVLLCAEGAALPAEVAGLLEPADFGGKTKQARLLYPRGAVPAKRLLLLGLGKAEQIAAETLRQAAATAAHQAQELQVERFTLGLPDGTPLTVAQTGQALAEGLILAAYRYHRYRTGLSEAQKFAVSQVLIQAGAHAKELAAGVAAGEAIAHGVTLARDLVNAPPNVLTPAALAEEAVALGKRAGLNVTVIEKPDLLEGGFGGIMAVGQASANEPRLIIMEYGTAAEGMPTLCLVGKGLTFDSGGLSIKPGEAMMTMKSDMSGAAAVLGAMQMIAALKLPLHIVGLVPAVENAISSNAYRPDDVITTLSGKTVEVLNTDAEGRIVLADALYYAQRYNPEAMIELSTLTGAIIIALGHHAIGLVGTDQALADGLRVAGDVCGERVWQLPLWDEYRDQIKSEIADMKNIGGRPGGSITAGAFLANFVGDIPFAHLDIAGTAYSDKPSKPYHAPGGTGVGVRLLAEFLRNYGR
ncbi:MAG: leucyl aminopeptidase [Oscillochloridaceae bacterium umkhey_bin13]